MLSVSSCALVAVILITSVQTRPVCAVKALNLLGGSAVEGLIVVMAAFFLPNDAECQYLPITSLQLCEMGTHGSSANFLPFTTPLKSSSNIKPGCCGDFLLGFRCEGDQLLIECCRDLWRTVCVQLGDEALDSDHLCSWRDARPHQLYVCFRRLTSWHAPAAG